MARRKIQTKTSPKKRQTRKTADKAKAKEQLLKEKIEKDKKLIMWSGVTFFMALILTFWIFNIKTVFKPSENKEENSGFKLGEVTSELSQSIRDFRKSWNEIKTEENSTNLNENAKTATSSELTKEEISELKNKIEELEQKLNNKDDNLNISE